MRAQCLVLLAVIYGIAAASWYRPATCGIDPAGPTGDETWGSYHSAASTTPPITCWIDDQAVYDCSLTVTEVPSGNSAHSTFTPRLYRKNYLPGREIYAGNCMTGQLTSVGYAQHVLNGQALRQTYVDDYKFLSANFHADHFFLRSDDMQRTTQSLEALMLGFYPPAGSRSATQMIDFYSMDIAIDDISPTNPQLCPFQPNVTLASTMSPQWLSHMANVTAPLYASLAELTGLPVTSITASHLLDCMRVHLCHNLTMPDWFNMTVYDEVANETLWQYVYGFTWPNATVAARVGIGHLWADLIAQTLPAAGSAARKFVYFSAHDTTIFSLLTSLSMFPNLYWPPYASLLLFELWQPNGTSDVNLRLIYNGDVLTEMPYENFTVLLKPLLPGDICTVGIPLTGL